MKRTIIVFGLIAGAILSILMIIGIWLMRNKSGSYDHGFVFGYASMLLAFCFIFVAIKNYRSKQPDGSISFGKAFVMGLWVALIASLCYTITWVILYKGFYPDFLDDMNSHELANLHKAGKSSSEIAAATKEMESMKTLYNTWPGLIGMTILEILPVGVLVALISALVLKRKTKSISNAMQPG